MNKNILPVWKSLLIAGLLGWAYFPTLADLFQIWFNEPQYSHGFLVPLFSLALLFRNRENELRCKTSSLVWIRRAPRCAGCRGGSMLFFLPLDALSLILCLTGLVMITGGRSMLRWTWQSLVFLVFMIPLPYQFERMMGGNCSILRQSQRHFYCNRSASPQLPKAIGF